MELTLQKSLSRLYIKSFTGKSFIIAEDEYHTNIIIDGKIKKWNQFYEISIIIFLHGKL